MADTFDAPQSRNEAILQNILGAENELGEPQSRIEELLQEILEQGGGKLYQHNVCVERTYDYIFSLFLISKDSAPISNITDLNNILKNLGQISATGLVNISGTNCPIYAVKFKKTDNVLLLYYIPGNLKGSSNGRNTFTDITVTDSVVEI